MGDPLSITASIVAVLQITGTVTQYLKDVRGGSEDRMRLRDEMRGTICLLEMLKDRVEDPDTRDACSDAVRLLNAPNGPFIQFKKALELLVQKLAPSGRVQQVAQVLKWPFDKSEVNEILRKIERLKSLFSLAMQNDHIKLSRAIRDDVQEISKGLSELRASQKYQENRLHDENIRNILNWISPLTFSAKQSDVLGRRQQGTCEWFFKTSVFQSWLNGAERILWCQGIPGAGETVLAATIISYLQNTFAKSDIGIAFIYCNYKEQDEQTFTGLVASVLRQILERCDGMLTEVQELYMSHVKRGSRPSLADYSNLLRLLTDRFSTIYLVIDALDETSEGTRDGLVSEILKLPPSVHLLCTSRHIPDIEQKFHDFAYQEVRASKEDVENYVVGSIEQNTRLNNNMIADPSLCEVVIKSIVANVDGMLFLLAQLHIESLARKHDRKAIRSALKQLPTELDDTYHEALERIYRQNKDDVLLAERILSWISYAGRTITVEEMQYAIAVLNLEPEETRIDDEGLPDEGLLVTVCAGLVTIDKENRVIRLVHYTAQQYFERIRETKFPHAQVIITKACLRYLSLDVVKNADCFTRSRLRALHEANPLLLYAARYWGHHAIGEPEHVLRDQILKFLAEDSRISYYILAIVYYKCSIFESKDFPVEYRLWLAATFSLKKIVSALLQEGADVDSISMRGETALITAVRQGNTDVVEELLNKGANPNIVAIGNGYCKTALDFAASHGYEVIVELLVKMGADINHKDDDGETALCKAAESGQLAVVRLLLDHGAELQSDDYDACSPLDAALRNGHQETLQLLMDNAANSDSAHKHATRALFKAASGGTVEAYQLMVSQCGKYGLTEEVLRLAEMVHKGAPTRLVCDRCEAAILNTDFHFHCDICNFGDFDLCRSCVQDGKLCLSASHQLVKRIFRNYEIIDTDS